jgi:type IV pilus assembly protein PilA
MSNKRRPNVFLFQLLIDHMIAILVLCTVMAVAIKIYLPYRQKARLSHVVGGSPFLEMRAQMMLYRALHGEWPQNNRQLASLGWWFTFENISEFESEDIADATIENGAIHFTLGKTFKGQIVTLRPAVPANDPLGPVIWICGNREPTSEWIVYGVDRTTVEDRFIPSSWR